MATKAGVSTIELLVAMTVLSTAAIGVFSILSSTETQLLSSRNDFTFQQSEEALGAYLYEEFISYDPDAALSGLTDSKVEEVYLHSDFPDTQLRYRSVMGNQTRYALAATNAKCRLNTGTSEIDGTVRFAADCVTVPESAADNDTIAEVINELLLAGIPVSFSVENVGSLCSVSTPMDSSLTGDGQIAVMTVDDPACLNSQLTGQPAANSELILPRFVVYSEVDANRYNTSLIERPTGKTVGIALTGPASMSPQSGVATSETGFALSSLSDDDTGVLTFSSPLIGTEISISDAEGATLTGNNTGSLTLAGTFGQLKEAVGNLFYKSPDGYFGSDTLSAVVRSGSLRSALSVPIDITPNCGGQLNGTATRLDLGYMDRSTATPFFDESTATFLTTVSVFDNSSPTHFYGYCEPNSHRYDYSTQAKETTGSMCNPTSTHGGVEYQRYSSRKMTYDNGSAWNINSAINVFLYEESDSMTQDRFALIFVLDGFPGICNSGTAPTTLAGSRSSGNAMKNSDFKALNLDDSIWPNSAIPNNNDRRCRLAFRLSNIEPGRDLDDTSDLHTFTDDPNEYTGVIGSDGQLTAQASWQVPIDGVVVPLRVTGTTPPVELRDYSFGNPIFELVFWDTLNAWNIRALDTSANNIVFRRIAFAPGNSDQTQAIRININQSRSCGS